MASDNCACRRLDSNKISRLDAYTFAGLTIGGSSEQLFVSMVWIYFEITINDVLLLSWLGSNLITKIAPNAFANISGTINYLFGFLVFFCVLLWRMSNWKLKLYISCRHLFDNQITQLESYTFAGLSFGGLNPDMFVAFFVRRPGNSFAFFLLSHAFRVNFACSNINHNFITYIAPNAFSNISGAPTPFDNLFHKRNLKLS